MGLCDPTYQTLEREFVQHELGALLVRADLTERDGTRTVTVVTGELPGSLATGELPGGLLGANHGLSKNRKIESVVKERYFCF